MIHCWHQICLNYEVLVEDLQRLSNVDTVQETDASEGAPLTGSKLTILSCLTVCNLSLGQCYPTLISASKFME